MTNRHLNRYYLPKELEQSTVCLHCKQLTMNLGTKLCNRCWELDRRIGTSPTLALKIWAKIVVSRVLRKRA